MKLSDLPTALPRFVLHPSTFILCLVLPLSSPAQAPAVKPADPLLSEGFAVVSAPLRETVPAVGTLRANEAVVLSASLSRRLVKVAFTEGSEVKANELLFKLEDEDLLADIAAREARRRLASQTELRRRELLGQQGISQQEYDTAKAELDAIDAEIAGLRVELAKTEVRAPFAGRTGLRLVSPGAWVTPATPLVSLQDLSHLKVDFSVPEKNAPHVKTGQPFTFRVAGSGEVFNGEVTVIEPEVDASTRGLLLRGLCRQPGPGLRPGLFADVTLSLDTVLSGFPVPSQAVIPSAKGPGLYVLSGTKAEFRTISIGLRTPDRVQVLTGIKEGETVLTTNTLRLRPGSEVRLTTAK